MPRRNAEIEREGPRELHFGPFVFDRRRNVLRRDGAEVDLPPRTVRVLRRLLDSAGGLVSKEALLDAGWNGTAVSEDSLNEAIRVIRRTLGDDAKQAKYIQTVHRRGYRFVAPIALDGEPHIAPEHSRRRLSLALAAAGAVLAAFLAHLALRPAPAVITAPRLLTRGLNLSSVSLSHDGASLSFVHSGALVIRDLGRGQDRELVRDPDGGPWEDFPPVWSPDDRRLAYAFGLRERFEWQARVSDASGGQPTIVHRTEGEELVVSDWSPESDALLLIANDADPRSQRLLELPLGGGPPTELYRGEMSWPWRARYSPDGKAIVLAAKADGRHLLYLTRRDGADPHPVLDDMDADSPLWSPDGRLLLFRARSGSKRDFWTLETTSLEASGGPFLAREDVGEDTVPWSWEAGVLVYTEPIFENQLYRLPMNVESMTPSSVPLPFVEGLEGFVNHAVPSRAGDHVALSIEAEGGRQIVILSKDDPRPRVLVREQPLRTVVGWGPDDGWILLWGRDWTSGEDVFARAFVDDAVVERLPIASERPLQAHFAALSPDGSRIALEEELPQGEREVVVFDLASGALERRLGVRGRRLMSAWSPEGDRIAVSRNRLTGERKESDIVLVSLLGEPTRSLAHWASDPGDAGPLTWSPDGSHVVFVVHQPDEQNALFSVPRAGGTPRAIYTPQGGRWSAWKPFWPEGDALFFTGMTRDCQTWALPLLPRPRSSPAS